MKLAHIINPVVVDQASDLFIAQPITFETMRRAQKFAVDEIDVELFSAQFPQDRSIIPDDFILTTDLERSVLDVAEFKVDWKLPLLRDILDRLYAASTADYFIYTNVDIALQPQFYCAVKGFIQQGYDSFVINRRTIPATYLTVEELDLMYVERGKAHRGWDCFVFPRQLYPHFKLFDVCVGAGRVGLAMLANLEAFSQRFSEFRDEYLTFHIGDPRTWLSKDHLDFYVHNSAELMHILTALEAECGTFPRDSIPGTYLFRQRAFGPLYDAWSRYIYLPADLSSFINRIVGRL
ncbi:MAG: hypothetical protein ACK2U0_18395 [Candidatus Promineifilaceae bacterium]